jgi:hypothetical protein
VVIGQPVDSKRILERLMDLVDFVGAGTGVRPSSSCWTHNQALTASG